MKALSSTREGNTIWSHRVYQSYPNRYGIRTPQRRGRHSFHAVNQRRQTPVHFHRVSKLLFHSHKPNTYHMTWSEDRIRKSRDTGSALNWQRRGMTDWPHVPGQRKQILSVMRPQSAGHPDSVIRTAMAAAGEQKLGESEEEGGNQMNRGTPVARVAGPLLLNIECESASKIVLMASGRLVTH